MDNHSIFVMSNREAAGWVVAVMATCGLALPFMLIRGWYLLLKRKK